MSDPTTNLQAHLPMFVLDVMRWADSYDSILSVINDDGTVGWRDVWQRPFEPTEIDEALLELKQRGLIKERETPDYYEITPSGRRSWEQWIPPGEAGERVVISRLLRFWDPIGVFGIDADWPEDEYESYVLRVIAALRDGAGEQAIAEMLAGFRVDYMGLERSSDNDARIAKQICDGWSRLHAT